MTLIKSKLIGLFRRLSDYIYFIIIRLINRFDKKLAFLLITPAHGNLGDHAIAYSEGQLLSENNVRYLEVTGELLFKMLKRNRLDCFNGNPLYINGGGYLGTLWFHDEELVREIIRVNPKSRILFFPNTVFFEDGDFGQKERAESTKNYTLSNKVKFYARELKSLNIFKEMGVSCGIAPDMVMRLKYDACSQDRSGCLMLMRKDCECIRSDYENSYLSKVVTDHFGEKIKWGDTVVDFKFSARNRRKVLFTFFDEIKHFELVITDRLHGMIFSAITGTPCIVLCSRSHKVLGSYEWLKKLDYIKVCDDVYELQNYILQISLKNYEYDNTDLLQEYDCLINDIKELVK